LGIGFIGGQVVLVKWYEKQVKQEMFDRAERALTKACLLTEGDTKRQCPVDTGRLRASYTHEITKGSNFIQGKVGTNVKYSRYVELGTCKMSARPHLIPAFERNRDWRKFL